MDSIAQQKNNQAVEDFDTLTFDMQLEIVILPVSDVDRAKRFYWVLG